MSTKIKISPILISVNYNLIIYLILLCLPTMERKTNLCNCGHIDGVPLMLISLWAYQINSSEWYHYDIIHASPYHIGHGLKRLPLMAVAEAGPIGPWAITLANWSPSLESVWKPCWMFDVIPYLISYTTTNSTNPIKIIKRQFINTKYDYNLMVLKKGSGLQLTGQN
jgi:hypothetical protein